MEFILENGEEYILVSGEEHLKEICMRIAEGPSFANQFKFSQRDLFVALLETLNISYDDFIVKYFYYDAFRKLHISESEFGYIWISTFGLIAKSRATTNRAVNACLNQNTVISLLFEKAIDVVKDERTYDVDSYNFGLLSRLSPAIFYNLTFYIEVFCKAYLSLAGIQAPFSHKLSLIYTRTVEAMNSNQHGNSLFQVLILDPLYKIVDHINKIPGDFKEHFIKYDDNSNDDTVILIDAVSLFEMRNLLELSVDFIYDFYYSGTKSHYLESNLFQRLIMKADTEEKKKKIRELYPHLAVC